VVAAVAKATSKPFPQLTVRLANGAIEGMVGTRRVFSVDVPKRRSSAKRLFDVLNRWLANEESPLRWTRLDDEPGGETWLLLTPALEERLSADLFHQRLLAECEINWRDHLPARSCYIIETRLGAPLESPPLLVDTDLDSLGRRLRVQLQDAAQELLGALVSLRVLTVQSGQVVHALDLRPFVQVDVALRPSLRLDADEDAINAAQQAIEDSELQSQVILDWPTASEHLMPLQGIALSLGETTRVDATSGLDAVDVDRVEFKMRQG
jgi:hypothetical protein